MVVVAEGEAFLEDAAFHVEQGASTRAGTRRRLRRNEAVPTTSDDSTPRCRYAATITGHGDILPSACFLASRGISFVIVIQPL